MDAFTALYVFLIFPLIVLGALAAIYLPGIVVNDGE